MPSVDIEERIDERQEDTGQAGPYKPADDDVLQSAPTADGVVPERGLKDQDEQEEQYAEETTARRADDEDEDAQGDQKDEDVHSALDVLLSERLTETAHDDGAVRAQTDELSAGGVQPRQEDEFACESCFLVKHSAQLVDRDRRLCADCV